MSIVANRVDERLVHGQIMTSWSKHLQLKSVWVVDDGLAKDSFMASVLALAAPAGLDIRVLSVADAASAMQQEEMTGATMLLFKRIDQAEALARALQGTAHPVGELNIGNIGSAPGRVQVTKNVFLSPEDKASLQSLQGMGVDVFLQMLYTDPRLSLIHI